MEPMIESIQFRNFKVLRDTTLPLSRCTVLVGANGSGKTTVLEALKAVREPTKISFNHLVSIDPSVQAVAAPSVEVQLNWADPRLGVHTVTRWQTGNTRQENERSNKTVDEWPNGETRALLKDIRVFAFDACEIAQPATVGPNVKLQSNGKNLAAVLDGLRDDYPERFDAINKSLPAWFPEFDCILFDRPQGGAKSLCLRTCNGKHPIPAVALSQGTLIGLAILTLAYLPQPLTIVGLEEPDRGIHPRLLRHIQDAIYHLSHPESHGEEREPVQVIVTTHSPYFLDLFKDHPEEIVVADKKDMNVRFERISEQPHFKEILEGAPLGEAWFTGVLGGVPSRS